MTTSISVFDHFGVRHTLEGYPSSYEDWSLGDDMSREHERFIESLEEALCGVVYKTRLRGRNMCQVSFHIRRLRHGARNQITKKEERILTTCGV